MCEIEVSTVRGQKLDGGFRKTDGFLAGLHPLGRMAETGDVVKSVLQVESAGFVAGETCTSTARMRGTGDKTDEEKENRMPIVTMQITREGTTREQKAALRKA